MKRFFQRLFGRNTFSGTGTGKGTAPESNSIQPLLKRVVKGTAVMTIVLFVALLIFFGADRSFVVFTVAIVMGAYYIAGCVLGFIFAIPKSFQNNQQVMEPAVDKDGKPLNPNSARRDGMRYKDNTSLEEISDWLTKIIIGLSLTQFNHLQDMIDTAARSIQAGLSSALCKDCTKVNLYSFSYALIILYSLAGACCGYLWTRIEFPKILKQKDEDLELLKVTAQRDEMIKSLNNPENKTVETSALKTEGVELTKGTAVEMMRTIISKTPKGNVPDDAEKGRWGGMSVLDNMKLSAEVTAAEIPTLFKVRLKVSTVDGTAITSPVGIVLHESFEPQLRVLDPNKSDSVFLEVIAYEAFTVGTLCNVESEQKYTRLELDLNTLPNLPAGFSWS